MIKVKKSLGQNFLINENILERIVSLIEIKNKSILELNKIYPKRKTKKTFCC